MQKSIFHIESNDPVARDTFRIVLRGDAPVAVRSRIILTLKNGKPVWRETA